MTINIGEMLTRRAFLNPSREGYVDSKSGLRKASLQTLASTSCQSLETVKLVRRPFQWGQSWLYRWLTWVFSNQLMTLWLKGQTLCRNQISSLTWDTTDLA